VEQEAGNVEQVQGEEILDFIGFDDVDPYYEEEVFFVPPVAENPLAMDFKDPSDYYALWHSSFVLHDPEGSDGGGESKHYMFVNDSLFRMDDLLVESPYVTLAVYGKEQLVALGVDEGDAEWLCPGDTPVLIVSDQKSTNTQHFIVWDNATLLHIRNDGWIIAYTADFEHTLEDVFPDLLRKPINISANSTIPLLLIIVPLGMDILLVLFVCLRIITKGRRYR